MSQSGEVGTQDRRLAEEGDRLREAGLSGTSRWAGQQHHENHGQSEIHGQSEATKAGRPWWAGASASQIPFESIRFYSSYCHCQRSGHLGSSKGLLTHFSTSPPPFHPSAPPPRGKIHLGLQPSWLLLAFSIKSQVLPWFLTPAGSGPSHPASWPPSALLKTFCFSTLPCSLWSLGLCTFFSPCLEHSDPLPVFWCLLFIF